MTQPTHVLHVLNGASGGAAMTTFSLIESLDREGIKSSVVCHTAGSERERDRVLAAVEGRATFTHLAWWNRKLRSPLWRRPPIEARQLLRTGAGVSSARKVEAAARRHGADLVHTNTILTPEGSVAARRLGLPHVWHVREMVGPGEPFRFWLEPLTIPWRLGRGASVVVANSHAAAANLESRIPGDKLRVVHNGIDTGPFEALAPPPVEGPLVVGMVANVTSTWKRHDLFVEMAGRVPRDLPIRYRIYGHVPAPGSDGYTDHLRRRVQELGLDDRFEWMGHIRSPVTVMSQLHLLVHPTPSESFGRIAVEAMASGRPVVGVRGGGIGELVAHDRSGLLVEPDDVDGMAAAVAKLCGDPDLRARLGAGGRQLAGTSYSQEAMVAGVLSAYEAAMQRPLGTSRRSGRVRRFVPDTTSS